MDQRYEDDIPAQLAQDAHRGTSFVPETRAQQERADYARTLRQDLDSLQGLADTPEKGTLLKDEFERYRSGLKARTIAYLAAKGRCVSTMIAGPANFNTRRAQKSGDSADRRLRELLEYRERAIKAIRGNLCPGERPIMGGDSDAVERLREKIATAEALQARMKATNSTIRRTSKDDLAAQIAALAGLGHSAALAGELLKGDSFGSKGYAPYEITNNSANIRRMKQRLAHLERTKAIPESTAQGSAARLEDCPAENRVRLYFPGKPAAEIRTRLKQRGFRWSPSIGAWQAYRNEYTMSTAREIAGITTA